MAYPFDSARQQWDEGERRLRSLPATERGRQERMVAVLIDELRRRLGSRFTVQELADLYGSDTDWASDLAWRNGATTDAATTVDAAFARYAREAADYAGGRLR
ncbi:MAG: hypothetical protein ACR2LY_04860 [Thermoleophilaceae bacterium]